MFPEQLRSDRGSKMEYPFRNATSSSVTWADNARRIQLAVIVALEYHRPPCVRRQWLPVSLDGCDKSSEEL